VVYGLYEVSIQLVARVERKREAKLRAEGLWDDEIHGEGPVDEDEDAKGE
jgi:sec-independent protein translocase protein TatC